LLTKDSNSTVENWNSKNKAWKWKIEIKDDLNTKKFAEWLMIDHLLIIY